MAAKAEPTVYYCNTTQYAEVTEERVANIRSYAFKLFIDLEATPRRVKASGEAVNFDYTDGEIGTINPYWEGAGFGYDSFFGGAIGSTYEFRNGIFAYTTTSRLADKSTYIASFLARCDKF